jgi:fatty acid desaturase
MRRAGNFHKAALHGSSHYDLPSVLRWFTANIGVHHVHHLCSRIPYYRLPRVLRDHPQLAAVGRLTLFQSLRCVRRVLWDEKRRQLTSFREMLTVTSGDAEQDATVSCPVPQGCVLIRESGNLLWLRDFTICRSTICLK